MSDREEIRWKFQQIQQVTETARLGHEKERENKRRDWDDLLNQAIVSRNSLLGGIGFLIVLIAALSAIDEVYKGYFWIIVVLIIIGLVLFGSFNIWVNKVGKKYTKLMKCMKNKF